MSTAIEKKKEGEFANMIERLVLDADLSKMAPVMKVAYYNQFCHKLNLNPLTRPFQLLKFQGKEVLYATKDCTEQLRTIRHVSVTNITREIIEDVLMVTAYVKDKDGREDAATGAVPLIVEKESWNGSRMEGTGTFARLANKDLANAYMKAETKAKRRATLSLCGLGITDESELDTMKGAKTVNIDDLQKVAELSPEEQDALSLWEQSLAECKNAQDVIKLYNENKEVVDNSPELQDMFKNRRAEFPDTKPTNNQKAASATKKAEEALKKRS